MKTTPTTVPLPGRPFPARAPPCAPPPTARVKPTGQPGSGSPGIGAGSGPSRGAVHLPPVARDEAAGRFGGRGWRSHDRPATARRTGREP